MKTTCNFFIVGFLSLICASCVSMVPERVVVNNRIDSTAVGISVQVDPSFEYIGKWASTTTHRSVEGQGLQSNQENFVFVKKYHNNVVSHGININFDYLHSGIWLSDYFGRMKTYIERGTAQIGGQTFQYMIWPSNIIATGEFRQFLIDNGLVFSGSMLFKTYAITSKDSKEMMYLHYMEDLAYNHNTSHKSYSNWTNESLLTDSQKQFIRGFSERAKSALFFDIYGRLSSQEDIAIIESTEMLSCPGSLDGIWKGTMITKSSNPNCADSGSFEGFVKNCRIDGELKTSNNLVFEINGRIDSAGRLVGGIASHRNNVGSFSGSFTEWIASGTWQDDFDCYGTWEAEKVSSDEGSIELRLIKLKELFDKGLITEPYYNKKKADILGEL